MKLATLEKQVKKNSALLEKEMGTLIKTHKDKYVVFNAGEHYITGTFQEGVEKGIEKFGEENGFVVQKATKEIPMLSSLVAKL